MQWTTLQPSALEFSGAYTNVTIRVTCDPIIQSEWPNPGYQGQNNQSYGKLNQSYGPRHY